MPNQTLPGPPPRWPGLAHMQRFRHEPLEFLTELGRTYGDLACWRTLQFRFCLVNSPELIREVLVTQHKSFRKLPRVLDVLRQVDGNGLVLTEGDFWLRQRRLVQPAFAPKRMHGYADAIVAKTQAWLERTPRGKPLDLAAEMTHLTLDIIARTLFGVDLGEQAERLRQAVHDLSEVFTRESGAIFRFPKWVPTPQNLKKKRAIRVLDELIWSVIRERRASGEDAGDLLSMLLLAVDAEGDGRGMTDQQARDEAMTLFNAGHDSTAAGLAWIWSLLGRDEAVTARVQEEVRSVVGARPATFADVARLPFTECVVKEALRLYPPTWIILPRESTADVRLGDIVLPRGTWVYIAPWVTHRDPRFFVEPARFDPDRFSPSRSHEIPPYAWLPFGAGPHVCIGNQFATMEMVLIVATILAERDVRLAPDQGEVVPEPILTIRPRGGLRGMTV